MVHVYIAPSYSILQGLEKKKKRKEIYLTNVTSRDMPDSQNQRK